MKKKIKTYLNCCRVNVKIDREEEIKREKRRKK